MKYILIIILTTFHGASVTTAEFETKEFCDIAATQIPKAKTYGYREFVAYCFPKGRPE